jgi:hypothetical protein
MFDFISGVYLAPIHTEIGSIFDAATCYASITAYALVCIEYE